MNLDVGGPKVTVSHSRQKLPTVSTERANTARIVGGFGGGCDCSALLETMMDGFAYCQMIYDAECRPLDWVYLAVNPAFAKLTGLADIVGKTVTEAIPGIKDSSPELFEIYGRVASGLGPEAFEMDFRPLSMWVHVSVSSPSPGYFFAVFEDITRRKEMEAILHLSQISLDCSADMIHWLRPDGRIIYTSDSSIGRTGYSRGEFLDLTIFDLDPNMNPAAWAVHWRELRASGSLSFATVHITKGGEIFPVEVTANYLELDGEEYNFAFTRDISDRRKLESSLRLTQLSVDRAADLIHWIDPKGRLLYVSDSTCLRHGYSREELLRMTIFDLDPLQTRTTWDNHWKDLQREGSLHFESVHRTRDGEVFPVEVVGNYVRQVEGEFNFVYARDISLRKRTEQELNKAKAALESQNRELEEAGRRLVEANLELVKTRDDLAIQARTDPLTGCLNRGAVLARLDEELVRADREDRSLSVGMLDIDHFKDVNDAFGHPAGDRVLCAVAERSLDALRPYDVFGRFGGEEFLLVVVGVEGSQARAIFERVRLAIEAVPVVVDGKEIRVTASVGAVVRQGESFDALIRLADTALYAAKAHGRNRVEMAAG